MDSVLVTGATGLVGFNIVRSLLARGRPVKALVRDPQRARGVLPRECTLVRGDVTDKSTLEGAMRGCDVVYHAAGLPEQWFRDPGVFQRVNVVGTRNMVEVALRLGLRRFVYTSTIDIFDAKTGEIFDESRVADAPKGTHYERSKQDADRVVTEAIQHGLMAVFLHPSGVYGPGPAASPGMNNLIRDLKLGKVPLLLPGGLPLVYAEDVGEGHVLAEEKASVGERFILSSDYFSLAELAGIICKALDLKKVPPVMPLWLGRLVASLGEAVSGVTGRPPLIPKGQLHFLQWQAVPSGARAKERLGWQPRAFDAGLRDTIKYLGL